MLKEIRLKMLALFAVLTLLASVVFTTPVFADGGAPASDPGGTTGASATSVNLTQVPAGTNVVVLDNQHHRVPLATQQAADIMAVSDPVWCPASLAAPTPGSGGCTNSFNTFNDVGANQGLITYLYNHQNLAAFKKDGTIWIASSYNSNTAGEGSMVIFDGTQGSQQFQTMKNYRLNFKGGWNGVSGSGVTNPLAPSTFNGTQLIVQNWNNDVTMSDILITGANASGVSPSALAINTNKNITLTRVNSSSNNTAIGASLTNAGLTSSSFVTITSSHFDNNAGYLSWPTEYIGGLYVVSNASIILTNVTASGNTAGGGALLDNHKVTLPVPVTVTGSSFNNNAADGLYIVSLGAIKVTDLTASGNGTSGTSGYGAELTNATLGSTGSITMAGKNVFNSNYSGGLSVASYGPITASNITANSNTYGPGASFDNSGGAVQALSLTGSSQFKFNGADGLDVVSKGNITLNNITASYNLNTTSSIAGSGAVIANNKAGSTGNVTLTGTNLFNNNANNGLVVTSFGTVSLQNLTANGNQGLAGTAYGYGVTINNSGGSTKNVVIGGTLGNTFSGNAFKGLDITSLGTISVTGITAAGNLDDGVSLDSVNSGVSLTGNNVFTNNHANGLVVLAAGPISASNLYVDHNGSGGPGLDGVLLDNSGALTPQNVTLSGTNIFTNNGNNGLSILSHGAITTNNMTANWNGTASLPGAGVVIDNCDWNGSACNGVGAVNIAGTANTFNGNYSGGLSVTSKAAVTLNTVTASGNTNGFGVSVDNCDWNGTACTGAGNVTFNGKNTFSSNFTTGLDVKSGGAITTNTLTASGNGSTGVSLDNCNVRAGACTTPSAYAVTLNGVNLFSGNGSDNLDVYSRGVITVNSITSNSSTAGNGAFLTNDFGSSTSAVKLTGVNYFSGNAGKGLYILSRGAIAANSLNTGGNSTGALLDNHDGATQPVTLSGINVFNGDGAGLYVISGGVITTNALSASNATSGYGVQLDNSAGASAAVYVNGMNVFQNNWLDGLYVQSAGAVTVNNVNASGNGASGASGYGVRLDNTYASSAQKVVVQGVTTNIFSGNYSGGLFVNSKGSISTLNLMANDNTHGAGVTLRNDGGSGTVTVGGNNMFNNNLTSGGMGLAVYSTGAITVNNVLAYQNGSTAVYLDNHTGATTAGVTMTGSSQISNSGNSSDGAYINTNGAVSLTRVYSDGNAGNGLNIANAGAVTLTCGGFVSNAGYGVFAAVSGGLKFLSVNFSGNTAGAYSWSGGTPTFGVVSGCP